MEDQYYYLDRLDLLDSFDEQLRLDYEDVIDAIMERRQWRGWSDRELSNHILDRAENLYHELNVDWDELIMWRMLSLWSNSVESPHLDIMDLEPNLYDAFIELLSARELTPGLALYRGTNRMKSGEVIYDRPTSWTSNIGVAKEFAEDGVILVLPSDRVLGVKNIHGIEEEEEYILAPHTSRELGREMIDGYIFIDLEYD